MVGFRGGIWMLWNDDEIRVNILSSSLQFIHAEVLWDNKKRCVISSFYASPHLHCRRSLWREIHDISSETSCVWLLPGDFNAMVDSSEKLGGVGFNGIQAREFRDCINYCSLIDLRFFDPKFTWFRLNLKERLDRYLCNPYWYDIYTKVALD
ncbi:hypothetical protein LINPERHAP2_LOCUS39189 [Linum perenne]